MVKESISFQHVWSALTVTFLSLVPKFNDSITASSFRPIALCNVIYNIISSVIAKRFKNLLKNLIDLEQSGFVDQHHILDGIIIAHEVIHSLKKSRNSSMAINKDLSKAYDKLN